MFLGAILLNLRFFGVITDNLQIHQPRSITVLRFL